MATLYITEYADMAQVPGVGNVSGFGWRQQIPAEPAIATQTVAISASSAQSAAFNSNTTFVRLHCDAICSVLFGANPTATASSPRMAANQTEYHGVGGYSSGLKVAVITNT